MLDSTRSLLKCLCGQFPYVLLDLVLRWKKRSLVVMVAWTCMKMHQTEIIIKRGLYVEVCESIEVLQTGNPQYIRFSFLHRVFLHVGVSQSRAEYDVANCSAKESVRRWYAFWCLRPLFFLIEHEIERNALYARTRPYTHTTRAALQKNPSESCTLFDTLYRPVP